MTSSNVARDCIETPAALIDSARATANARRAGSYCRRHGLRWRPHVKTHKSSRMAQLELDAGAAGVTVATLREAEVMSTVTSDILLAYPPVGDAKLKRLTRLPAHVQLTVALDSLDALTALATACSRAQRNVGILIELDLGGHRVGVQTPEAAVALAQHANILTGTDYRGILFHPGHITDAPANQQGGLDELNRRLQDFCNALAASDLPPTWVSGGNTPTLWRCHELPALTEVRAGTYLFNDYDTVAQGAATLESCAYTVLTTVVSTSAPNQAVVDAGSKALSKERHAAPTGYGIVYEHPEVIVSGLSEEHGLLDLSQTDWLPKIGEQIRIVPNHVCASVNLQDNLYIFDDDPNQLERLTPEARGRAPFL